MVEAGQVQSTISGKYYIEELADMIISKGSLSIAL